MMFKSSVFKNLAVYEEKFIFKYYFSLEYNSMQYYVHDVCNFGKIKIKLSCQI
ncbi:MAG: hypothetical protein ISP24_05145 [Rickettsiales bacterium]|nr:hypothetical protein [Rickettsiales bacterium]